MVVRVLTILSIIIIYGSFTNSDAKSWQDESGKGWYNYAKNKEKTSKKLPKPKVPPKIVLMEMPPKQFRELYEEVTDYALTYRSLENFTSYELMRQTAIDRATEFASLQQLYNQLNPTSTAHLEDTQLYDRALTSQKDTYLNRNKSEYGLIYFYSTGCAYCKKQEPLIEYFKAKSEWNIEKIDINLKPKLKEYFAVETVPAIILVDRQNNFYTVTTGYVRLDELEDRLYRYLRYIKGETNELNFGDTPALEVQ